MTAKTDDCLIEQDGPVVTVTINDPPYNAMSLTFIDELEQALPKLAADASVRAIVIRGAGEAHFSVGMNLKQIEHGATRPGGFMGLLDQRLRVIAALEDMPKPVIVTLNGYCLGGGLELPLGCHFRLAAAEGAKIGLPEMDLGTVPAWGGSARLSRRIGRDAALDMILRKKKVSGPEGYRLGFVNEVVANENLHASAQALAQELACLPRLAVAELLQCMVAGEGKSRDEMLALERRAVAVTWGGEENREGISAFLEKRAPHFN